MTFQPLFSRITHLFDKNVFHWCKYGITINVEKYNIGVNTYFIGAGKSCFTGEPATGYSLPPILFARRVSVDPPKLGVLLPKTARAALCVLGGSIGGNIRAVGVG